MRTKPRPKSNTAVKMLKLTGVVAAIYLVSAFIAFDMSKPAIVYDEEIRNGREVALGPRPRSWACKPTHHDVAYGGREWPFRVYLPVCGIWRLVRGFEAPTDISK